MEKLFLGLKRRLVRWLLKDVPLQGAKFGTNTITMSPPATGDVVEWSASQDPDSLGQIGMNVVDGRPRIFTNGKSKSLGPSDEIMSKSPVRAATTAAGTLATDFENGDTIDGVTLATGDRILIKDQATGSENGIYTVNASGAPTRATDFDDDEDVMGGSLIPVSEGTTLGNTLCQLSTDDPITVGTTPLSFAKIAPASAGTHASNHTTGQSDEIDGDKLDIDWNPTTYTPSTTPAEADNLDNLTAHLYGIDQDLGTAIHDNVSGEISAVTEKTAPVAADLLLIEDSAASNAKKRVQIGNLPITVVDTWVFKLNGKPAVQTDIDCAMIAPRAATITRVTLYRRTAGTSGSTIVDVNKNGTTIYTTQGNRPTVTQAGGNDQIDATTDMNVTAVAQNDRIEVDVDQVEAGNPQDLAVIVEVEY